ncbi:hypothetical protein F3Y22_tig00110943pilonHSYRG00079 [Hibiscus syriacus]|uniref:Uncharacterized protein n=1 Tax=Hibiscus syriacus TaxID=106335 RepID=A0A6A2ZAT7_HIBSY|nr:hypothetical protein F3Y22_tig00110943pilonHSYRG00079 [Hibiscus syriacus]
MQGRYVSGLASYMSGLASYMSGLASYLSGLASYASVSLMHNDVQEQQGIWDRWDPKDQVFTRFNKGSLFKSGLATIARKHLDEWKVIDLFAVRIYGHVTGEEVTSAGEVTCYSEQNEAQLEKDSFHTEVVDEIVLDSEDEGRCRIPCLDSADSIDKQLAAGKKLSSLHHNSSDGKQEGDHEIGRSESEVSSEATALCFVDSFLSFNGTRRFAKIIKRGSPVKEMGAFEWFESCLQAEAVSIIDRGIVSSKFGDFSQQDLHNKGSRSISNKHEELVHLQNDIRGPSHSLSIFKDHCSEASTGIEKESEGNVINGYFKAFDELMPTKSSSEKLEVRVTARDVPDIFDVGIGTQIAAEVMEALYYGIPPICNSGDACEGLENTFTDLQEGETKSTTHLERNSLPKVAASESGEVAKVSIRRKSSARRFNKDIYSSLWNYNDQKLSHNTKPNRYQCKQSKVDEHTSSNNLKKWTYVSPSIPDEQTLLRKQLSWEKPVSHKSRHSEGGVTAKNNNDQVDKPILMTNNVNVENMLTYKRKRKRLVGGPPPKLLSGKQKCSELHSYSSIEASDGRLSEQQQSSPEVAAIARLLRLDSWNCPKGKRTLHKVPIHSSGESNMHGSFTSVGTEEQNPDSLRSQKMPEDGETNSSNFMTPDRINCSVQVAGVVTNNDLAVTSISAKGLDGAEAAQTGKLDFVDSTSIINGLKNSIILENHQERVLNPLLMGLGVPELISDFAHRGFRTRKGLSNVRVMFSQHLDDDLIKQQKKSDLRTIWYFYHIMFYGRHTFHSRQSVRTWNMLEAIASGTPMEKMVFITQNVKPNKEMISSLSKQVKGSNDFRRTVPQVVETSPKMAGRDQKIQVDLLILSCEQDLAICTPLLERSSSV